MSWRDDMYSDDERALQAEVRRLREVIRELEEENQKLKEKFPKKKYCVTYYETYVDNYEIEATSPEEAVQILRERIKEGEEEGPGKYSDSRYNVKEL